MSSKAGLVRIAVVALFVLAALVLAAFALGYFARSLQSSSGFVLGSANLPAMLSGAWTPVEASTDSTAPMVLLANGRALYSTPRFVVVEPWWSVSGERMRVEVREVGGGWRDVSVFTGRLDFYDHDSGMDVGSFPVRVEAWLQEDGPHRRMTLDTKSPEARWSHYIVEGIPDEWVSQ